MATAKDVIKIANDEVGYLEKTSNANLYSKTANAGKNNYTKYAYEFDTKYSGFYNGKKNGFAWCDMFVDWCFVMAFGVEKAKKLLCQPSKSLGAGCKWSRNYYKEKGQLHTSPKVGDQIFFYGSKKSDIAHTGLVYDVDKSYVYTIEGNTSSKSGVVANGGCVAKKKYKLNYSRIAGYGRPKYDEEVKESCEVTVETLKKGCEGANVKALQILLIGYGYDCGKHGADGDFGADTERAVRDYQEKNKLTVDGVVGKNTWNKLLGGM